jgi:sugar phosphate isomerase/epimerase
MNDSISRRRWLALAGTTAAAYLLRSRAVSADELAPATRPAPTTTSSPHRYRIAACDWMMLKRQKLGAIKLAREVGLDGVEVDMGGLGDRPTFDNKLTDPQIRGQFVDACREHGIEICSLAMSGFYAQSFPERDGVERMVQDCIDTMTLLGVKVAFLPLGVKGDLVQRPELRPAVVERLKAIAPHAEKAGVVIGVETALDAAGDVRLLDNIGSPAVRIYFNFANALRAGRDLHAELRTLGAERICQIHCTDQDGVWLRNNPRLKMPDVKRTLDEMGWSGWLVIERSRDASKSSDVKWNFSANASYLKSVFQSEEMPG